MKSLFGIFIVCLFVSCGKYKKPFITFKSPEKRLTETTWRCIKAVDTDGNPLFLQGNALNSYQGGKYQGYYFVVDVAGDDDVDGAEFFDFLLGLLFLALPNGQHRDY